MERIIVMSVQINFKKLVRFIKASNERLWLYYGEIPEYKWWRDEKLNFLLGIPTTDKKSPIGITAHIDYHGLKEKGEILWDKTRNTLFGKVNGDENMLT